MSVAEQTPAVEKVSPGRHPPRRNGRWAGYLHLLGARMLELKREPEVVFWVFVFPLLLALGLGIAFRNKPGDASSVAIVSGAGAQQAQAMLQHSPQHASFKVNVEDDVAARKGFRLGKYDLVIEPDGAGGLRYRYDPARPESVLARAEAEHGRELAIERVLQFAFSRQWDLLQRSAARSAIRILGDVAIFVNMDSADVWVHPGIFELDDDLKPIRVAGVPPDYFSATGQRWGNPLYRWDVLAAHGPNKPSFAWWIDRVRRAIELYDIVRLDHFRGFEAYWAIPANEETAVHGEWVKAPGLELFRALEAALGPLPLVAEDLGLITPEVDALRVELGLPGMKVLQFGFSDKGAHTHLPHRFTPGTVAYTGTHDNDTTQGWWRTLSDAEHQAVEALVGPVNGHPAWPLIRAAHASVAEMVIVPAQDLLELGSEARMNTPAVATGNWSWRAPENCWTDELAKKLAALAEVTDRDNDPLAEPVDQPPA